MVLSAFTEGTKEETGSCSSVRNVDGVLGQPAEVALVQHAAVRLSYSAGGSVPMAVLTAQCRFDAQSPAPGLSGEECAGR